MGDFDPHQCFKQPLVVSEALEWEIRPTPLMTEVLNDEVNLIDVVDLVVDNEMVSVLKVRWPTPTPSARDNAIAENQHELKLLAAGPPSRKRRMDGILQARQEHNRHQAP